jgi:hypothetical protein
MIANLFMPSLPYGKNSGNDIENEIEIHFQYHLSISMRIKPRQEVEKGKKEKPLAAARIKKLTNYQVNKWR